ncbi:unnamed protein product [Fraxinus pennsylvanica]|uniref:Uncharacterized protein n=1 Tax=Fraxinus pennsylvanica TaxID=56036 RepID=A0AAD1ZM59_9LAMI|nr:unnamed protein product [Fraxinus pennsylvanica]
MSITLEVEEPEKHQEKVMEKMGNSDSSFTNAMELAQMGISSIPNCYILPPEHRPNISQNLPSSTADLPVIDLSMLENPILRELLIEQVSFACKEFGFFQVYSCINSYNR